MGDRFSKPLDATYLSNEGKPKHLQMGCFGLGLSRILAATLEILSENDQLRWPRILSPYTLILIGPKVKFRTLISKFCGFNLSIFFRRVVKNRQKFKIYQKNYIIH